MKIYRSLTLAAAAFAAGTAPALAHIGPPGHEHGGFAAGLAHPVSGLDHLLAMLAVGIWSAIVARGNIARLWVAPAAFVAAMVAGAIAGHVGVALPLVETGIALSVVLLGIMIWTGVELPTLAATAVVALFAVYHGHAHGAEASGEIAAYIAGFALTTGALHGVGIGLGMLLTRVRFASHAAGAAIAAAGVYLLAQ